MSECTKRRCIGIGTEKIRAALNGEYLNEIVSPEAYGESDSLSPEKDYWASEEEANFST